MLAFALELPPLDPVVLDGGLLAVLPDALAEGLPASLALVRRVRPAGHAFQTTWREKRGSGLAIEVTQKCESILHLEIQFFCYCPLRAKKSIFHFSYIPSFRIY